jgi:hypothetical protein
MQPQQKQRKDPKNTRTHTWTQRIHTGSKKKGCNVTGAQRGRTILEKNPAKLVGWDYPSAPRLRRKAGKKIEQVNHHQKNMQEKKSTYDDPWRRLMIMTKSRLSRKSCNPYKKKHTKQKRASNPNYEKQIQFHLPLRAVRSVSRTII